MSQNVQNTSLVRGERTLQKLSMQQIVQAFDSVIQKAKNQSVALPKNNSAKSKLYFAAPWFNELEELIYKKCQCIFDAVSLKSKYEVFWPKDNVYDTPNEAFLADVREIKSAEIILALVTTLDVGTAWEIGYAYALNKKIVLLGFDESCLMSHINIMLGFSADFITIESLQKLLVGTIEQKDFIKIDNTWQGKQ
ncbi:MAG: nucleoside 2-deoxyribosyltransferase [Clostridiales bacterium]|jgi:nucleoside 2-deoxyribosyltransferase|nr:nucleoside 2-deoxyribosyltransferase [Clostridiales bacterium]